MTKYLMAFTASVLLLFSCVSSKKFKKSKVEYEARIIQLQTDDSTCNDAKAELLRQKTGLESDRDNLNKRVADLNKQIDYLKENNTTVLKQLQNLSVVSSSQAENIKKSLDNIGAKDMYIQDLEA